MEEQIYGLHKFNIIITNVIVGHMRKATQTVIVETVGMLKSLPSINTVDIRTLATSNPNPNRLWLNRSACTSLNRLRSDRVQVETESVICEFAGFDGARSNCQAYKTEQTFTEKLLKHEVYKV